MFYANRLKIIMRGWYLNPCLELVKITLVKGM